jgi:protein-tyrosine phosphatase
VTETLDDPARRLPLTGCFNFRDLGGYPAAEGSRIRWRRLFRADGLSRLDNSDCDQLADLGLATVIDLRTLGELDDRGRLPEGSFEVEYHHLPLTDVLPPDADLARYAEPAFVTDRYRQLFSEGSGSIRRALEVLAEPGALPAVFHCSAGKDRTGVLAALVLGFLGVPDDAIVDDYALSGEAMVNMLEWLRTEYEGEAESVERYAPAVTSAHPEAMANFLSSLRDEYGGFDELAASLDVTSAVASLKASLLVPR